MGCQKWLCLRAPIFLTYFWRSRWCEGWGRSGSKDLSLWNVIKKILTLSLLAWQDIVHIWKWSYFHLIEQEFSLFSRPRRDISSSKSKHNGLKYFMKKPFHEILSVLQRKEIAFQKSFHLICSGLNCGFVRLCVRGVHIHLLRGQPEFFL